MPEEPPISEITTELRASGDGPVLVVAGEIDLLTVERFERALLDAQEKAASLMVDIREVTFMDSTGLRTLLEARRRAEDGGAEIALSLREDGPVARLLDLAGVADMFPRRTAG